MKKIKESEVDVWLEQAKKAARVFKKRNKVLRKIRKNALMAGFLKCRINVTVDVKLFHDQNLEIVEDKPPTINLETYDFGNRQPN